MNVNKRNELHYLKPNETVEEYKIRLEEARIKKRKEYKKEYNREYNKKRRLQKAKELFVSYNKYILDKYPPVNIDKNDVKKLVDALFNLKKEKRKKYQKEYFQNRNKDEEDYISNLISQNFYIIPYDNPKYIQFDKQKFLEYKQNAKYDLKQIRDVYK